MRGVQVLRSIRWTIALGVSEPPRRSFPQISSSRWRTCTFRPASIAYECLKRAYLAFLRGSKNHKWGGSDVQGHDLKARPRQSVPGSARQMCDCGAVISYGQSRAFRQTVSAGFPNFPPAFREGTLVPAGRAHTR